MTQGPAVRFGRSRTFQQTLRQRINQYFETRSIAKTGNAELYFKSVFMFFLYVIPFLLLATGFVQAWYAQVILSILMGLGMSGIGLCIMHDANHGSFSKRRWVNNAVGYILNFVGGASFTWKVQHNVIHHSYTNIEGVDEDITTLPILRFNPHAPLKPIHKFQFIYAWLIYGLMSIFWVVAKDFIKIFSYRKKNLITPQKTTFAKEFTIIVITKILYFGVTFGMPLWFGGLNFWWWLGLFMIMHYVAGLSMALIFQPAHVVSETSFPLPDENGEIEENFALHQLQTTANYGNKNRLLNWCSGGLNFQIEHHLFPTISHVHYRHIAKIVKETAKEFDYPYHEHKTFRSAISSHARLLYQFGRTEPVAVKAIPKKELIIS